MSATASASTGGSGGAESGALVATAAVPSAASATSVGPSSYLHCPLCLDAFTASSPRLHPRLLPACAHSICTRCLQQQWSLQSSAALHPTFLCPLDSAPVRVTSVDDIPVNRILLGLLSSMESSEQSSRDFRVGAHASPRCVEESCAAPAEWYCLQDDADMCTPHKEATHAPGSNITKNHRVCRWEEKERKRGPPPCAELGHGNAPAGLWCTICRGHACLACAAEQPHASHPAALRVLGPAGSSHATGGSSSGASAAAANGNYSEQQSHLIAGVLEEERRMKASMEREARELIQTLQG